MVNVVEYNGAIQFGSLTGYVNRDKRRQLIMTVSERTNVAVFQFNNANLLYCCTERSVK